MADKEESFFEWAARKAREGASCPENVKELCAYRYKWWNPKCRACYEEEVRKKDA